MKNSTDEARQGILRLIQTEFRPGDKLVIRDLARRLGVSATPIREALRQLAEQGFVDYVPGGGAFVRQMSLRELMDTVEVRAALEAMLARRFVARATEMDFEVLEELSGQHAAAAVRRDLAALRATDIAFHHYILEKAENLAMTRCVPAQRLIFDVLASVVCAELEEEDWQDVDPPAHCRLVEAFRTRDPDKAAAAMNAHVQSAAGRIQRRWIRRGLLPPRPAAVQSVRAGAPSAADAREVMAKAQ